MRSSSAAGAGVFRRRGAAMPIRRASVPPPSPASRHRAERRKRATDAALAAAQKAWAGHSCALLGVASSRAHDPDPSGWASDSRIVFAWTAPGDAELRVSLRQH